MKKGQSKKKGTQDDNKDHEAEYGMLGELEHILARPDMYIGSIRSDMKTQKIVEFGKEGKFRIIESEIAYNAGMERLFLEIISNAADNARKSRELKIDPGTIRVKVEGGTISVRNEGRPISTKWHSQHKMWVPEMIFSHLRAGSNFNDDEDKKWAGRNGLGAKLCACYSKSFAIDILNAQEKVRYQQEFINNLGERIPPRRVEMKNSPATSYTEITYKLDFKRFYCLAGKERDHHNNRGPTGNPLHCPICWEDVHGPENSYLNVRFETNASYHDIPEPYGDDPFHCLECWEHNHGDETQSKYATEYIGLIARLSLDFAFNCNIPIVFENNGEVYQFDITSPLEFAKAYMPELVNIKSQPIIHESRDGDTRMVMVDTPHNGSVISFANGMPTIHGGVHVNEWLNGFAEKVKRELEKKYQIKITVAHIRNHVTIFLSVYVPNPEFDSQLKQRLTRPKPKVYISPENMRIFETWRAVQAIKDAAERSAKNKIAKATDGKKASFVNVPTADDAGQAGKSQSHKCVAFFVEGLSAKTFFVKGMEFAKGGREFNGCYPLRGKLLNVRKAKTEKIMDSKVIKDIKTFLGLREKVDYTLAKNRATLRYGKAMILVDADDDGIHIKGLLLNFFETFRGLLESGYVEARLNPVIVSVKSKMRLRFYSTGEYERWKKRAKDAEKYSSSYFKGLGTATEDMIRDCFGEPVNQTIECGERDREVLNLAFGNDGAAARKQLYKILISLPEEARMDTKRIHKIEDMVYEELIIFARTANRRHIPVLTDGMKDSYRKVIFAALKSPTTKLQGVEEFAADVKKWTKYRHGSDSLKNVCVSAGQGFPGSNNIPYMDIPCVGVGSRIAKGDDHSNPRYLTCRPSPILRKLFRSEDDIILEPIFEDGKNTCVKTYYPILPLQLVNECSGIGWGWANHSVSYNPIQLIEWINYFIQHVKDGKPNNEFDPPRLVPWWRGYTGILYRVIDKQWITRGRFRDEGNVCYVTDIPVTKSALQYEESLNKMVEKGIIREWKPIGTDPNIPQYRIEGYEKPFTKHKDLHLEEKISENNMTYMDEKDLPINYPGGAKHVCAQYCMKRYEKYVERKEFYTKKLEEDLAATRLRLDFVVDVIEGRLVLGGRTKRQYGPYMTEKGYPESFLKMSLLSITEEKASELRREIEKLEKEIERYKSTHPGDFWLDELEELRIELEKLYPGQWEFSYGYGVLKE